MPGSANSPVTDVVKVLALVLWSAVLPSSGASKCRPFSMGNLPAFLRIDHDVNLGTWVNRSQGTGHPLMRYSARCEHRQLCGLGKRHLI